MQQVARQVAVAVDNALNFQAAQAYQQQLARERDRLRVLLEVNNAVVSTLDLRRTFSRDCRAACGASCTTNTPAWRFLIAATQKLRTVALDLPQGTGLVQEEITAALENTPAGPPSPIARRCAFRVPIWSVATRTSVRRLLAEGVRAGCCVPLVTRERVLGTLNVASLRDSSFSQEDVDLLSQVATQVAIAVENALAFQEIAELKNKLAQEKLYLEDEIRTEHNFEEIVGESPALKALLQQVRDRRSHRFHRADWRRNRHGQGTHRARHP